MSKKTNKWQKIVEESEHEAKVDAQQTAQEADAKKKPGKGAAKGQSELDNQLAAQEKKLLELKDQLARLQAEAQNERARHERVLEKAHKFANEKLVADLLPVIDSLDRGLQGVDETDPVIASMLHGMQLTREILQKTIEKYGVKMIAPEVGSPFNPEFQEAVTMQPDPDMEPNCVISVLQKGYELNGRVLRAAMVIVSQ